MAGRLRTEWRVKPGEPEVQVGDYLLPASFRLRYEDYGDGPDYEIEFEIREGVPQCRAVRVIAHDDGDEVLTKHLRKLRLEDLLEHAMQQAGLVIREGEPDDGGLIAQRGGEDEMDGIVQAGRAARSAGRAVMTTDLLREVATVYRSHEGRAPTKAVADHFGKGRRTASLYVRQAREAGMLEELS